MPLFRPTHLHNPWSSMWDWDNLVVDRPPTRQVLPSRIFDQNFGLPLDDDEIFGPTGAGAAPYHSPYAPGLLGASYRPRRLHPARQGSSGVSQVDCSKDAFEVKLDVQQFSPEEITVKTVNAVVVIEGNHGEKQDEHGLITRHFVRKYVLPEDVKPETVSCHLSSDGVLTITAPRVLPEKESEAVKVIPIIQTGRPAVLVNRQCSSNTGCCGAGSPGASAPPAPSPPAGNTTLINITRENN